MQQQQQPHRRRGPCALALLCAALLLAPPAAARSFYDILNVPKHAGEQQIKRSYRKLALQFHPDKVSGGEEQKAEAAKRFAEINHAYETLSGGFVGFGGAWGGGEGRWDGRCDCGSAELCSGGWVRRGTRTQ
jgi:hypothetical protein